MPLHATAQTQPELDNADDLAREAIALHRAKRFAEAGAKFLSAYEISRLPVQLENAAKSYDLAEQIPTALSLWRRYLRLDAPAPEERTYAEARVAALEERLARNVAPRPPPPLITTPAILVTEERPATPPPWPAIGVTAGGALAAAIGAVFLVAATQQHAALEDAVATREGGRIVGITFEQYERDQATVHQSYAIGGTLLGVGLTTAAIGAVLWLTD